MIITVLWRTALFLLLTSGTAALMALPYLN